MCQDSAAPWQSCSLLMAAIAALALPFSFLGQTTSPAPSPILLGTAWYPEHIGEFAWSQMEPGEGQFDLDWIDRAITAASKRGIYTVLGTPTAASPAWMTQKYPETHTPRQAVHGDPRHASRLFALVKYGNSPATESQKTSVTCLMLPRLKRIVESDFGRSRHRCEVIDVELFVQVETEQLRRILKRDWNLQYIIQTGHAFVDD